MIRTFRLIRKKLLSDGKTGKYLRYAIGEILLVMIGILLALQVNNWNESRKLMKAEKGLLNNLYENLEADSIVLQENRQKMLDITETQKQLHAYRKGKLKAEEIENARSIRGSIRNYSITQSNHPDIAVKITNEKIKDRIREYYRLIAFLQNAYIQYDNVVKQVIRPYMAEKLLLNPDVLFAHQDQIYHPDILNFDRFYEVIKEEEFGQILFESNLKANEAIAYFDELLAENSALRRLIKAEIL